MKPWRRLLTNKYFATVITLFFGYLLTLGGYNNVWPLFGSANQLLAALVLIALAVFLKDNRTYRMDFVRTNVYHAGSYFYRTGSENNRSRAATQ
ncbi:MAG: carbon starvation CstA family protein [Eubacterium sp.]